MDTVHAAFLHGGADQRRGLRARHASTTTSASNARRASSVVIDTEYGTSYGAYRPAEDDTYYWRIAHMLFPFYAMIPTGALGQDVRFSAYVPMDDDHHAAVGDLRPQRRTGSGRASAATSARQAAPPAARTAIPNGTGWLRPLPHRRRTWRNDYLIDREAQAHWQELHRHPRASASRTWP